MFFQVDLQECILLNISDKICEDTDWCLYWAIDCHNIWNWHIKEVHVVNYAKPFNTSAYIEDRMHGQYMAMSMHKTFMERNHSINMIQQLPHRETFVKLNVDGACVNGGISGCGGVIRDAYCKCICGFSKLISKCIAFMDKIWGMFEGLKLTTSYGYSNVEINVDTKKVIDAINMAAVKMKPTLTLINHIKLLMAKHDVVDLVPSGRRIVARTSQQKLKERIQIFQDAPDFISKSLEDDLSGFSTPRVVLLQLSFSQACAFLITNIFFLYK